MWPTNRLPQPAFQCKWQRLWRAITHTFVPDPPNGESEMPAGGMLFVQRSGYGP